MSAKQKYKVSRETTGYSEIMESLRELGRDYLVDEAVQEGIIGKNMYEKPEVCRYVLWRYEEHLAKHAGSKATVDEQVRREIWETRAEDSIEHIFPQNPESGGAWDKKMKKIKDRKSQRLQNHVHRIGNLLLLPKPLTADFREAKIGDNFAPPEEVMDSRR